MEDEHRVDDLVMEIQRIARETYDMDTDVGGVGRMTWVAIKMRDEIHDTDRMVTITMSVDGVGTISPPWDEAIANAMGRMIQAFAVPPDEIGRRWGDE